MNKNRKAAARRACLAMLVTVGLLGGAGVARAQEKPAAAPAAPASAIKEERALKRLQAMSDTLAGAKTLRFQYRGLLPVTGPEPARAGVQGVVDQALGAAQRFAG